MAINKSFSNLGNVKSVSETFNTLFKCGGGGGGWRKGEKAREGEVGKRYFRNILLRKAYQADITCTGIQASLYMKIH